MKVADDNIKKNVGEKKRHTNFLNAAEEPEDMELSISAMPVALLNNSASVFDEDAKKLWGGINTTPSVFEQQTVINTHKNLTIEKNPT